MEASLGIIRLVVELVVLVVGVVWAFSKVQSTTLVLNNTIDNLRKSVDKIDETVGKISDKQIEHEVRLGALEIQS